MILDLASSIAGRYCTKLLTDGGYDGDAVIWSRESGQTLAEVREAHPDAVVTAITPFGTEGPWADRACTEFTLQAWSGGIVGLGRGSPDRAPVFVGGQVGEWLTGVYAAIGTMVAQPGELVDVSMLEVLALCLTYYPVTYFDMVGRPMRKGRSMITPAVAATSDGLVGVGTGTGQQWLDFCVMVGHPEWTEDRKLIGNHGHLAPVIAEWMAAHTTAEVLELADTFRVPHAPIGNGETIPKTDHFIARGSIVDGAPGPPYRFTKLGDGTPGDLPLDGLRVLDLTAFWAGPLCTHILAMLGAEVIHIESTARPDGTRMLAGLKFSVPDWWEQSGIFAGLNTNKKSVTLDLGTERGKEVLRQLLATCDVLVENYTPRVLDQLGLDLETVRTIRPDLVMVRMPGFGLDGPWRDKPAFAFVIEDAAGLTWMTGYPNEKPLSPYCVGDANAGLHALMGLLVALEQRRRTGEGVFVEAAMVDAALSIAADQITEYATNGVLLERDGNRGPLAAPQGLYLAADADDEGGRDTWVAIAVATDEQWLALRDALGQPAWATDASLLTGEGRRAAHDEIDEHLSAWCADRAAAEIVDCLWPAGVPVAKVMQPHEQPQLEQLQFRRFFEDVEHPVTGAARHSTVPFRFSGRPGPFHVRHAPLLGEHNEEVLRGLGLSDAEIAALESQGVIGRAPASASR